MEMNASQPQLIHRYLKRYHSITSYFAWRRFNITRLADVIHRLKRRGVDITTQLVERKGSRYARYVLR